MLTKALLLTFGLTTVLFVQLSGSTPIPSSAANGGGGGVSKDGPDLDMLRNYYMFKDRQFLDNFNSNDKPMPVHSYLLELQDKLRALQDQEMDNENEMFKYNGFNPDQDLYGVNEKRAWNSMSGSWGKRVAASNNDNWNKFRGIHLC